MLRAPTTPYVPCPGKPGKPEKLGKLGKLKKSQENRRSTCRDGAPAGIRSRKPLPADAADSRTGTRTRTRNDACCPTGPALPGRTAAASGPAVRRQGGARRGPRAATGRPSGAETALALTDDDTPSRSPDTGGQRAGRTNIERPAAADRTVAGGSEVILHRGTREAYEAVARR